MRVAAWANEQRWVEVATAAGLATPDGTARPTIFAQMSAIATSTGAANLGQGFPDEDGPRSIAEVAAAAVLSGHNQYPPGPGIAPLRQAIAAHQHRHYGVTLDPDTQVLVTAGATEALAAALLALVGPGDEVIVLEPTYDSYTAIIAAAGARLVPVPLRPSRGFALDPAELAAAVTPRTRIVLLNSPHNPTGMVLSRGELQAIADVAAAHDLLVVTDEVYEHLVYDGVQHLPIATLPGMAERTLTISSAGKTFSFTGWKIGWITGPAHLVAAVRTIKQFLTYVSGAPLQPAIAAALNLETTAGPDSGWTAALATELQRKRDDLTRALTEAGLTVARPSGTYFLVADATPWLERTGLTTATELCLQLPGLAGVVGIPVSAFVAADSPAAAEFTPWVRFTFCKAEATMQLAADRLRAWAAPTS